MNKIISILTILIVSFMSVTFTSAISGDYGLNDIDIDAWIGDIDMIGADMDTDTLTGWDSWDYTTDDNWNIIIEKELNISMMNDDNFEGKDIYVKEWATLTLGVNVDITGKIILENAKSLTLMTNATVEHVTWTVENFDWGVNATIKYMFATVTKKTILGTNGDIEEVYLKTNNIELPVNGNVNKWKVFVYQNYSGQTNGDFSWKLTVFDDYKNGVNADFKWELCVLGKISLGVNADVASYTEAWVFGNVKPIFKLDITEAESQSAKVKSASFDTTFNTTMASIKSLNGQINVKTALINKETDVDKKAILVSAKSGLISAKTAKKNAMYPVIESTFTALEPNIDDHEKSKKLFQRIKKMYINAVKLEDGGQVFNVCNNSEIDGGVNSSFVKNGKIYFDGLSVEMDRYKALPDAYDAQIQTLVKQLSDDKFAAVLKKVNDATDKIWATGNEKMVNILLDIKKILKEVDLYQ